MPAWLSSGFSPMGLLAVVLQQIPGIVWAIHPPAVDPFAHNSGSPPVEILEKTFGIATVVLLVVVLARVPVPSLLKTVSLVGAFAVLAAYYLFGHRVSSCTSGPGIVPRSDRAGGRRRDHDHEDAQRPRTAVAVCVDWRRPEGGSDRQPRGRLLLTHPER